MRLHSKHESRACGRQNIKNGRDCNASFGLGYISITLQPTSICKNRIPTLCTSLDFEYCRGESAASLGNLHTVSRDTWSDLCKIPTTLEEFESRPD